MQFDVESLADAAQNGRGSVPRCTLAGGVASTYLLEKSRVVHHSVSERNYHIFYQLLASSEDEKIAIWDGLGKHSLALLTCMIIRKGTCSCPWVDLPVLFL